MMQGAALNQSGASARSLSRARVARARGSLRRREDRPVPSSRRRDCGVAASCPALPASGRAPARGAPAYGRGRDGGAGQWRGKGEKRDKGSAPQAIRFARLREWFCSIAVEPPGGFPPGRQVPRPAPLNPPRPAPPPALSLGNGSCVRSF